MCRREEAGLFCGSTMGRYKKVSQCVDNVIILEYTIGKNKGR